MLLSTIRGIRNWWALAAPGWGRTVGRAEPPSSTLRLRPRRTTIEAGPSERLFLTVAIHAATSLFGAAWVPQLLDELLPIEREVNRELAQAFTPTEIRTRATGGVPEYKEPVLYLLVRRYRPQLVIETGVAQGISTRFILEALRRNGTGGLVSIDLPNYDPRGLPVDGGGRMDPTYVKRELGIGWLVPPALRDSWRLLEGRAETILPSLDQRPDLFFHDSSHSYAQMRFEFAWAWERLPARGILVSDDIGWNAAFAEFVGEHRTDGWLVSDRAVGVIAKRARG